MAAISSESRSRLNPNEREKPGIDIQSYNTLFNGWFPTTVLIDSATQIAEKPTVQLAIIAAALRERYGRNTVNTPQPSRGDIIIASGRNRTHVITI